MRRAALGMLGTLALGAAVLGGLASWSAPADAAKPGGKFVKSRSECYDLASQRAFTGSSVRTRSGRFLRDRFIRRCRRGLQT